MRFLYLILICALFTSCWPSSMSFIDKGSMPPEWKIFFVQTLENTAPNTPLSYSATLSEAIKDGIQNSTQLSLGTSPEDAQIELIGEIINYSITPIAMQEGDNAAQNRLSVSVKIDFFITAPEEDKMSMTTSRFIDYDSNTDLSQVESTLLEEVNVQIVQDVVNKLLSNW